MVTHSPSQHSWDWPQTQRFRKRFNEQKMPLALILHLLIAVGTSQGVLVTEEAGPVARGLRSLSPTGVQSRGESCCWGPGTSHRAGAGREAAEEGQRLLPATPRAGPSTLAPPCFRLSPSQPPIG